MVEHVDMPDSGRHEPKGASTAINGQVLVSNGDGTTSWVHVSTLVDPSNFTIESVFESSSTAGTQTPSAVDTPLQVEFGPAVNGPPDPAQMAANGLITINTAGMYKISVNLQCGRTGSAAGVSKLLVRKLINSTQSNTTSTVFMSGSDTLLEHHDESWLVFEAGDTLVYQIMQDSTGAAEGGLILTDPTVVGWDSSPTASIRVERFIQQV